MNIAVDMYTQSPTDHVPSANEVATKVPSVGSPIAIGSGISGEAVSEKLEQDENPFGRM